MKIVRVPINLIVPDPEQPRKIFPPDRIADLADNIQRIGQQVPGIGYQHEGKVMLLEGECRWRAITLAGRPDMLLILLPERPTKTQLRIIQNSLDVHRVSLNPMERSNMLADIVKETGWGVGELGEQLSMKQSICSKLLACQKLAPEVQGLLATGGIDLEKAYVLSQLPGFAEQVELLKSSAHLSRDAIRAKVKGNGKPVVKAKRAVFMLPGGARITFKGAEATIAEVIDRLAETIKELRKGLSGGLDISTVQKVLKDKARSNHDE